MRISTAGTLAALAATVSAFADTAPFVIFASEDVSSSFRGFGDIEKPIVSAADLPTFNCPKVDHVLIITQEGVNVADFADRNTFQPLKSAIAASKFKLEVPETVGEYAHQELFKKLQEECGYEALELAPRWGQGEDKLTLDFPKSGKSVLKATLDPLVARGIYDTDEDWAINRAYRVALDDTKLLKLLPNYAGKPHMVLYVGLPFKGKTVPALDIEEDWSKPCGNDDGDLERPYLSNSFQIQARSEKNATIADHRPLFEKYQFFTPGLFMGLLVTLLLLSILFVALRAISSLEVSYAAFEKEAGPTKKAQ